MVGWGMEQEVLIRQNSEGTLDAVPSLSDIGKGS